MALCSLIILSGCTQEKEFINEHNHPKIDFKEKSFKEALSLPLFNDALKKVAKQKGALRSEDAARTALEDQYGFTIVTDAPIRIITDENGTVSYTILIEREVKEELVFENLMIKVEDEETAAAIFKYAMTGKGTISEGGEYFFPNVESSTFTDLNVEGRVFYNSDTGEACITTSQVMCNATWAGEPYNHIANLGCYQYAASHSMSNLYESSSTVCFGSGGGGGTGGGGTGGSSNNTGGLGGSGGNNEPIDVTPIPCRTGNCIEELFDNNCDKLQNLLKPEKQVVAAIASVRTNSVGFNGEKGARLSHSSTINPANNAVVHDYSVTSVSTTETVGNSHQLRININEFTYGFIHSHPVEVGVPKAVPMFSLYDLNALIRIYNTTLLENKQDVVFMLVIPGGDVYALKVDDIALLTTYVDSFNDIKDVKRVTDPIKKEVVKNKLFDKRCRNGTYDSDNENDKENKYVMGFLDEMRNKGLSLYRAVNPSAVTGWEKLTYPSPFSAQPTATPCQ